MPSRSNPFDDIERMVESMSEQFGGFDPGKLALGGAAPVDIVDTGETFEVTVDLPGFEPDDIDLRVIEGTTLVIGADSASEADVEETADDAIVVRSERSTRSVERSITLPAAVEEAAAEASFDHGVLTVTLPKREVTTEGESIPVN
ncbi:Hsp20/alpha crystallin family protein [Halococcoides cellulosivorans]|uniref:Heat-shock protein Hsp20 n=1 Tax=Halococcoides cellulosivorans TaxID=1679096 RepID=A0A2R4X1E5_9EURY|nr:Hsp20/alpha crystallin family protein [Halococcoides cellulosivorans]AWB27611.1 heat-shock protein Hsp20 [Halococcoides cellulosivorans]